MAEPRKPLMESILQKIADTLAKYQTYAPPPETDSSTEVRTKAGPGVGMGGGSTGAWYDEQMESNTGRIAKYNDYRLMDEEDPEISSALDIYADNATKGESETDTVIEIISDNVTLIEVLEEHIQRLRLDDELWSITRELVRMGDVFAEVVAYEEDGEVHRLKHLEPDNMVVKRDSFGRLDPEFPYEQQDETGGVEAQFSFWQILHFQMNKERGSKYGVGGSVLSPIRKLYKQLAMMEDGMVLARLTRAIQRYAFLIDTTGIEPGEATQEYVNTVAESLKKRRTIDPRTGKMDLKYNPMSMEEDIFIGIKEGSNASVSVLQGQANLGALGDVEYFRNKKFAGLKVPKAYLSHEKDVRARAMITEQDVQFARTVRRVQLVIISQLRKLFDTILATRGIDPIENEYHIKLPALSTIDEMRVWQVKQMRINAALILNKQMDLSLHWLMVNLLGYDEDDVAKIIEYLDDPDSLDNILLQRGMDQYKAKGDIDSDNLGTNDVGNKANSDPVGGNGKAGEDVTAKEIMLLRRAMKEDIKSLEELITWKLETARTTPDE